MKNVLELRDHLCDVFLELRKGEVEAPIAKELVNAAGKIINTVKLELEYAALRKETPVIKFLGGLKTPTERSE